MISNIFSNLHHLKSIYLLIQNFSVSILIQDYGSSVLLLCLHMEAQVFHPVSLSSFSWISNIIIHHAYGLKYFIVVIICRIIRQHIIRSNYILLKEQKFDLWFRDKLNNIFKIHFLNRLSSHHIRNSNASLLQNEVVNSTHTSGFKHRNRHWKFKLTKVYSTMCNSVRVRTSSVYFVIEEMKY